MSLRVLVVVSGVLCLGGSAPAVAQPESRPRPRKAARLAAVVLVESASGVPSKALNRLDRALRKALKTNKRLKVVTASRQLEAFAGELPTDTIDEAKKALRKAFGFLEAKDYRKAIAAFTQARNAQAKALNYIRKRDLALAEFGQALAYYHNRLQDLALRSLADLFSWRPSLKVDEDALPKRFVLLVRRARREAKKRLRGTLVVRTRPSKARAYLNGHSVGRTPLELDGVPLGTHYLTLRKRGHFKATVPVKLPKVGKTEYVFTLKQNEKFLLLTQALKRTWPAFGKARATPAMEEIKTLLGVEQVILVRPAPPTAAGIKIEACLYDLRTGNLLKRISGTLPVKGADAAEFAGNLYAGVRYDGTLPDPGAEKVDLGPASKPIWKRWWFWTAVGAAVVATVTGIAVPLAVRDKGPDIPGGYRGVSIRF